MSRMCNIDDREDIALYRNILHNDERQKISCTLIKDKCKKPQKDSYLRISEGKWLLNLKALYNT